MQKNISRREMLRLTGQAVALGALAGTGCLSAPKKSPAENPHGVIIGEENGAAAGMKVLAEGGNAIDAMVTAALVSCVAAPARCGIGGYGGHLTLALAGGKKVISIDFNTAAPLAAHADMYPLDAKGEVIGKINYHGWLAAGVPGTLAGLQLALSRYGTRSFREVVQPAIAIAREGATVNSLFAKSLSGTVGSLRRDPAMAKVYLRDGQPLRLGETFRNADLAAMLTTLAERNSVESFYRGDIAQRIADGFKKNGGLVTADDLAVYHAREVEPLSLRWNDFSIHTAPLTAGGLTVLEAFAFLQALKWDMLPASPARAHAKLEALRLAWRDRLELFGDPEMVKVPVEKLLSADHAREGAEKISEAVRAKRPLPLSIQFPAHDGTVNQSCVDKHGNMVAVTLTHGSTFGAQVAVDGLGLTLGHGMSRFNPHPGHPNAPGPGKRPVDNMCPSVVLREGKPWLAIGGAGGVRIPNSMYDVLVNLLLCGMSLDSAIEAPRLHCPGALEVEQERVRSFAGVDYFREVGYKLKLGISARISAATIDVATGGCSAAAR